VACVLCAVACSDARKGSPVDAGTTDAVNQEDSGLPDVVTCVPSGTACSILPQCGCSTTQSCVVVSAANGVASTACLPAGGVAPFHACNGPTCLKGYQCTSGACAPYCDANTPCENGGECIGGSYLEGGQLKPAGYSICTSNCALEDPASVCGPGLNCVFFYGPKVPHTGCDLAGSGIGVGACATVIDCAAGYACVGQGDCRKWCRLGIDSDCLAGQTCEKLGAEFIVHGVEYGACY